MELKKKKKHTQAVLQEHEEREEQRHRREMKGCQVCACDCEHVYITETLL